MNVYCDYPRDDVPCNAELKEQEFKSSLEDAIKSALRTAVDSAFDHLDKELTARKIGLTEMGSDRVELIMNKALDAMDEVIEGVSINGRY